jgi:hypothetical protein
MQLKATKSPIPEMNQANLISPILKLTQTVVLRNCTSSMMLFCWIELQNAFYILVSFIAFIIIEETNTYKT